MTRYKSYRDPRLQAECAALGDGVVPCRVWSPDGSYWVATCATHEETAGSLVADGMPEADYWPTVVAGYRASIRRHNAAFHYRNCAEYACGWISATMDHMNGGAA